jgi:hypothetical protein
MVGDIVGYCLIKKDTKTLVSAEPVKSFTEHPCRVLEFAIDGGAMILNPQATGIAMVEKEDIISKFECGSQGDFIFPPKLTLFEQMAYVTRLMQRKGGYNDTLRKMVIGASLHSGKFNDNFLWQKQ